MEIRKIVVPTDFSDTANKAVDQAVILALKHQAELTVLHARVLYQDDPTKITEKLELLQSKEEKVEAELLEHMKKHIKKRDVPKIKHEIIRGYSAPSALLGYINNHNFDLVVIGTHGRSGLEHFLIGSVAEKVVRYARSPVLTIHSRGEAKEEFKNILVPFDFSDHSKYALKTALEMAESDQIQIILFYVVDKDVHPALQAWGLKSIFEIIPDIIKKAEKRMNEILSELPNPQKVTYVKKIVGGVPHKEIAEYVKNNPIDLIVIATHGLVGIDRLLLGSTTEKIIRCVDVPILSLKQKNMI